MTDECYQCFYKCDIDWACSEDCGADPTCKEKCEKNAACKAECGECLNAEEPIFIHITNNPYDGITFSHEWQLVPCREGVLQLSGPGYRPCADDCNEYRDACLEN